jgi:hypothetical protein
MPRKLGFLLILVVCIPLMACSANGALEAAMPGGSTETNLSENAENPTEAPVEISGTSVTTIDQLVGTWIAAADLGNFVMTIFPDGKLSIASSLVDLENGSTDSWNLTIEDGQISATGFALCLGDIGSYLAVIDNDGNLKYTSIIDACDSRLRKMDRSLPGRLSPYNLLYFRVE